MAVTHSNDFLPTAMRVVTSFFKRLYYNHYIPRRIKQLRRQEKIVVAFELSSLGAWKSEGLYIEMLAHPRFEPIIVITSTSAEDDRDNLKLYCSSKGYAYSEIDYRNQTVWDVCRPDIVFYQKHYCHLFPNYKVFIANLRTVFCYVPYSLRNSVDKWYYDWHYLRMCWQVYYENDELAEQYSNLVNPQHPNSYSTGVPVMDEYLAALSGVKSQWKVCGPKKKIIYAPHHSVISSGMWDTSSFLLYGERMLDLAEKYSNQVQWAFKPHPLLRNKLESLWGKAKTDEYYRRWAEASWSQYESGKYLGLFMHSDAMIHDCGSFILEYMYTGKPVMYINNDPQSDTPCSKLALNTSNKKALALHYIANSLDDIENFIKNVIAENDSLRDERQRFLADYLTPPCGRTAAKNIIECILDEEYASRMFH